MTKRKPKTKTATPVRAFRITDDLMERVEAFRAEEEARHPELLEFSISSAVRLLLERALSDAGHPADCK